MLYNTKLNEELYMDYTWEKLSSREFEIIACNFAGDMFPGYEWKLTANTRDYNHDFFAKTEKLDKWGEAKHYVAYTMGSNTCICKIDEFCK